MSEKWINNILMQESNTDNNVFGIRHHVMLCIKNGGRKVWEKGK